MSSKASPGRADVAELEALLRLLAAATFLVFFQAFMIAPLIPRLAELLEATPDTVALAVPAYLVPYGAATLIWGPLSDRIGRGRVILASLVAFVALTASTALVGSAGAFIAIRLATAIGASGVVPVSLALLGDLYAYRDRGRPLGWLFGAMAGGIAFGSSTGALLEPLIGWRWLFVAVAVLATGLLFVLGRSVLLRAQGPASSPVPLRVVARGYADLLRQGRARRTYGFVLLNAVVHSGIYTWIGLYFARRFGLGEAGIGLAILGYGVPGFVFGPVIGRLADKRGRARLIPLGLAVAAVAALALASPIPLIGAALVVAALSLGYDLTQPLLAGIVTHLAARRGQAMGLNVFTLFVGFGLGSLVFQLLLRHGFTPALIAFGVGAGLGAAIALPTLASERRPDDASPAATEAGPAPG